MILFPRAGYVCILDYAVSGMKSCFYLYTLPAVKGWRNIPDEVIIAGTRIGQGQHILLTFCIGLHKADLADCGPVALRFINQILRS